MSAMYMFPTTVLFCWHKSRWFTTIAAIRGKSAYLN